MRIALQVSDAINYRPDPTLVWARRVRVGGVVPGGVAPTYNAHGRPHIYYSYMGSNTDEQVAKCQHVPTYGERGFECAKCSKLLFRYWDTSPPAQAVAAEARRIVDKGFKRERRRAATAEEMQHRAIELINQAEVTLLQAAQRDSAKAMSIADVLQLLIHLRTEIRRIE